MTRKNMTLMGHLIRVFIFLILLIHSICIHAIHVSQYYVSALFRDTLGQLNDRA